MEIAKAYHQQIDYSKQGPFWQWPSDSDGNFWLCQFTHVNQHAQATADSNETLQEERGFCLKAVAMTTETGM